MRRPVLLALALLALGPAVACSSSSSPAAAPPVIPPGQVSGDVTISADSGTRRPISPWLYGLNNVEFGGANAGTFEIWATSMPATTISRVGGNRSTGLNWESGYSNCGVFDCGAGGGLNDRNMLDNVFASPGVGNAWRPRVDQQVAAGDGIVVTAPILGWVAWDAAGATTIPVAPNPTTPGTPNPSRWRQVLAHDPAGATATPSTTDAFVYTDDFVAWLEATYPGKLASGQIQVQLDNEPDIWSGTHSEIMGTTDGRQPDFNTGANQVKVPFPWYAARSVDHARWVKAAAPGALVWAGGFAGWDGLTQFNYPNHAGPPCKDGSEPPCSGGAETPQYDWYFSYLLDQWKAAETTYGHRLVDVFDMHWYLQDGSVTNDDQAQTAAVVRARVQAPRSLWDPYYVEGTWVNQSIPDPFQAHCQAGNCPIALLPRMQASIDAHYPGTKIALGEYWYGRGGDISAAIANADVLGIAARHGVHAAAMWWNASNIWAYNVAGGCAGIPGCNASCNNDGGCVASAAYRCALKSIDFFRNYDGAGSTWGDTYVQTAVADPAFTSPGTQDERVTAYAATFAGDPARMVVVAINKTAATTLTAAIRVTHTQAFGKAAVWRTTGANGGAGGCSTAHLADLPITAANAFTATLPPQSVTVLALRP